MFNHNLSIVQRPITPLDRAVQGCIYVLVNCLSSHKLHFLIMEDIMTTNEYLVKYCDGFDEAESTYEKAHIFLKTNLSLLRQLKCPKSWLVELEWHRVLKEDEAEEFSWHPSCKTRLYVMLRRLYTRTKMEDLPRFISLMRPLNSMVANSLQERFEAVSQLVR